MLRITDDGSVPEMRISYGPYLKWCIHLSRSIFLYLNYLVSVTAICPVPEGSCSQVLRLTSVDSYLLLLAVGPQSL